MPSIWNEYPPAHVVEQFSPLSFVSSISTCSNEVFEETSSFSCLFFVGISFLVPDNNHCKVFEFKLKDISNPCYFHYQYLHGNSAGHHIKPNLSHMLRLCYRCCNSCNDYNCSTNAANQIRDANKREYSRCAASVNHVLNRLV